MATTFFKGLVVDVLSSTSKASITNRSIDENKDNVTSDAMKNFPRNTVIVKTVSEGQAKKSGTSVVCYPMFSSHFCMPVKPGEYVWFIYEDPENKGSIAYWISRVSEPNHVEDVNYTFSTRTFTQVPEKEKPKASEKFDGPTVEPDELQTFSWQSPTANPQEMIELVNLANQVHRFEPVPRYTKRPGDLVLQGSNNSLIMLGEERGHWASDKYLIDNANNPPEGIEAGHPAIDIVVGRGFKKTKTDYKATSGKSIKNEFGLEEIDKREKSIVEGDAHFISDATRIYLTSNSSKTSSSYHPDVLLGSVLPEATKRNDSPPNERGAFAVIKSDNLRLVSRNVGSIRIVKEPSEGKNDGSAIMMYSDGQLQIAARQIILSSYNTSGATEPYLKQSAVVSFLTGVLTDLSTLCSEIVTAAGSLSTSTNAGGPVAGAVAAGTTLTLAASKTLATLTAKIAFLKLNTADGVNPLGSTTIYGE